MPEELTTKKTMHGWTFQYDAQGHVFKSIAVETTDDKKTIVSIHDINTGVITEIQLDHKNMGDLDWLLYCAKEATK